jgi:hypothetical protein
LVSSFHLRNLLDKKLRTRLTIPIVISTAMIVVIIADLLYTSIPLITFAWIFVGIIVGYPFGRLTRISWTSDNTQLALVGSGIALLVAFIIIRIITSMIIRMEFGYLPYVLDIVLLVSVGGTIGKTLGMMKQIRLALVTPNPSPSS